MRHLRRRSGFVGAVDAAEKLERRRIERLRTETDSIHARRAHSAKFREIDSAGIRFERYLGVRFDSANSIRRVNDRADGFGIEQRRRSAAEEDRADTFARVRRSACAMFKLRNQRAGVLLL